MAINRSSLTTSSIVTDNLDVVIEMLVQRPSTNKLLDPPVQPNRLVGYYNSGTNRVELYLSDAYGTRWSKVS